MGQTILTTEQRLLLAELITKKEIVSNFYLTGGTALSEFYFQHRLSEDFDFFSEYELQDKELLRLVKEIAVFLKIEDVEYQTLRGQLTFFFHFPKTVVKVDFAQYPFPPLGQFKHFKTLKIASILDIGVNKLQAIQTRKRGRDFFDLYQIIKIGGVKIDDLLGQYRNKFDLILTQQELAKHFIGVLDAIDQPRFLGEFNWSLVEEFFLKQSKQLMSGFIG
jgi:predicted nucleotidyltransferase component of viral defense system